MKWICDHRSESQFKQLRNSPKKGGFRGFKGIRTRGLCVRAAVLYQLSYEDPYTGGWPIYYVYQPVKGMKHRMKLCKLREYKWNEYVTIAVNHRWSPEILFFFRAISQLLTLRFTAMVTYSIHLYFRSSHHFILYPNTAEDCAEDCQMSSKYYFPKQLETSKNSLSWEDLLAAARLLPMPSVEWRALVFVRVFIVHTSLSVRESHRIA